MKNGGRGLIVFGFYPSLRWFCKAFFTLLGGYLAWKFRNQIIFGPNNMPKGRLFDDIIAFSFSWCRSRSKSCFSRIDWLKNPSLISL